MSKTIIFSITGCIILVLVAYILFIKEDRGIYAKNDVAIPRLYQSYQNITEAYTSDTFKVEEVFKAQVNSSASPNPIRAYQSVQGNIIVDCDARKDDETKGDAVYFKINKDGIISDSLYVKYIGYWTVLIDDFMVHTDEKDAYFTTWPVDGDTTRRTFVAHNANLQLDPEELGRKLLEIKEKSVYYFVRTYVQKQRYFTATYFYVRNQWQVLWQETSSYQSVVSSEDPTRYQEELYRSGEPDVHLDPAVTLQYFHPQDSIKYYHIIGGGSPGTAKKAWRGTVFFDTKIGTAIFLFSIPNLVTEKERHDGYKMRLYQVDEPKAGVKHMHTNFYHSPFGFALYAPQAKHLFVIRQKTGTKSSKY